MKLYTEYQELILEAFKNGTFLCTACGKVIFPTVTFYNDGKVSVENSRTEIRGGRENPILIDNICEECANRVSKII